VGVLFGVAAGFLALGWVLGRCAADDPADDTTQAGVAGAPKQSGSPADASAPGRVQLRLDAGGLQLLPDASLRLKPIEPLDLETPDR